MLRITLVLFIVGEALAQIESTHPCPNFKTVPAFEVARYMGKWYETAVYTVQSGIWTQCVTAINTLNKNGSFKIENTLIPLGGGKPYNTNFTATPSNTFQDGEFTITPGGAPYWVLNTDYDNWALVWSCGEWLYESTLRSAWIYTRARYPSKKVIEAVWAAAAVYHLSRSVFIASKKSGCPKIY